MRRLLYQCRQMMAASPKLARSRLNESIVERVFALLVADLGLIPGIPYGVI